MERKLRQYTQESKKEAVLYSLASEKSVKEIAKNLGISYHNMDRRHTQYRTWAELAFHGHGKQKLTAQEAENQRLKKELADTQIELAILKVALAIFTTKKQ